MNLTRSYLNPKPKCVPKFEIHLYSEFLITHQIISDQSI